MNIILFSRKQVNHRPEQLQTMLSKIESMGMNYVVNEDFANDIENILGITIDSIHRFTERPQATANDIIVTYGGDGTLLEAVGIRPTPTTPIVGINCGRLGYLTADNGDGIEELFERINRRDIAFEQRSMLQASVNGVEKDSYLALNEIAIHRHGATMITIEATVNDKLIANYHGDGLVVSTPTGSTAYSLSAGGPVVDPMCSCFVLSPLAPHNLTMRPVVVPDNSTLRLKLRTRGGEAFLSADNRTFSLTDHTIVEVKIAEQPLILATPHNNTFYDTLREKMMWGVDNR